MNKGSENSIKNNVTTIILAVLLVLTLFFFSYFTKTPSSFWYKDYSNITDEMKNSELFEDMQSGSSFCFLGDSITCGTETNGITWYDPLKPYITGHIDNLSHGGWTSQSLVERADDIPVADIYVVAIGVNDVDFTNTPLGTITPQEYIENLQTLSDIIFEISPNAKIYFITPWAILENDYYLSLREVFANELINWCDGVNRISIDPYPFIIDVLLNDGTDIYLLDKCHPNGGRGVALYSYAVLYQEHQRRIGS